MREVTITNYCDVCWQDGAQRTAASQTWAVAIREGEKPGPVKLLEVCDPHAKLLADVALIHQGAPDLAQVSAAKVPPAAKSVRPAGDQRGSVVSSTIICPVCDQSFVRTSARAHIYRRHRGMVPPRGQISSTCPICQRVTDTSTGSAQHLVRAHGIDPLYDALSGVDGWNKTLALRWARDPEFRP